MKRCPDDNLIAGGVPVGTVGNRVVHLSRIEAVVRYQIDTALAGLNTLVMEAPADSDLLERLALAFLGAIKEDEHLLCSWQVLCLYILDLDYGGRIEWDSSTDPPSLVIIQPTEEEQAATKEARGRVARLRSLQAECREQREEDRSSGMPESGGGLFAGEGE